METILEVNKLDKVQEAIQILRSTRAKLDHTMTMLERIHLDKDGNVEVDRSPTYGFHMYDFDIAEHIIQYIEQTNSNIEDFKNTMIEANPWVERHLIRNAKQAESFQAIDK